jgi:hypothetical protein
MSNHADAGATEIRGEAERLSQGEVAMNYSSMSIDRRAQYYARSAQVIAADPLDFYTRAERGRKLLAEKFNRQEDQPKAIVDSCLTDMRRRYAIESMPGLEQLVTVRVR